ncbi:MAG: peptide ABC transporter substrate-binding protein [Dehalococcoidia bacterium]|nr:peptide ABC transporter substrate-binding protein [Dehalococcoidia bacterium]
MCVIAALLLLVLHAGLFGPWLGGAAGTVAAAGGVYTEALVGQPSVFNPLLEAGNRPDRDVDRLVFSGLTTWDTTGRPIPDLAASWWVSQDGLTYTFNLRDDVRWHDGQPFDADDVVFTVGLLQSPDFPGPADLGTLWRSVTVTRVSQYSVQFTLPEPFAPFLDYTAIGILPEHRLQGVPPADLAENPFNQSPIGTGPYRVARLGITPTATPSGPSAVTEVVLENNPDYYGRLYNLHEVRFRFFPDAQAALEAYEAGFVQGISDVPGNLLPVALEMSELNLFSARLPSVSLIYLNLEPDRIVLFHDKLVRQALLAAINRQWMIDNLLDGQGFVASSPILPGTWAYNPNLIPLAYDPLHAGDLLENAGWALPPDAAPGTPEYVRASGADVAEFTLLATDDPVHQQVARKAVADWAAIGVRVTIESVPAATVVARLQAHDYQAALTDIDFSRYPDPDPYPFWHQTQIENGQNYSSFNHRETSQLLEAARVAVDVEARAKLYRAFQARFADQVPALLLYYPVYTYGVDARVQNVQMGPMVDPSDRFRNLADWYVLTRRVIVTPGAEAIP